MSRSTTQSDVDGVCVWALEDDTGRGLSPYVISGLGVTTFDGHLKPGIVTYRDAIAAVFGIPNAS